jgi:urease accessory protein
MMIVETIIGNIKDAEWKPRLDGANIDWLVLDQWDAQKNRFRRRTRGDVEIAISLERNTHLHDGDILVWDEDRRTAIAARILLKEVMIIDLTKVAPQPPEQFLRTCFELGHALGNQHWPAVVRGSRVFVPLTVDRQVMTSVMRTHGFPGIHYEFVAGSEVIPYLAPHESRRLFGGADATPHSHVHSHES